MARFINIYITNARYTQHLILSFVNLEKKINERKEFCDAETLNQQK